MDFSTVNWRKSSYSTSNGGNCVEVAMAWRESGDRASNGGARVEADMTPRQSGYSGGGLGGRVEVAGSSVDVVAVRDSKDPGGPVLTFSPAAWQSFTSELKSGDLPTG